MKACKKVEDLDPFVSSWPQCLVLLLSQTFLESEHNLAHKIYICLQVGKCSESSHAEVSFMKDI